MRACRVPLFFPSVSVYVGMCVIQHRNWPLRSTILNAHDTNCSADGFYARTHINEPYLCYYVVCRSKLAEADAETCVFTGPDSGWAAVLRFSKIQKIDQRFFVSLPGTSTSIKYTITVFFWAVAKTRCTLLEYGQSKVKGRNKSQTSTTEAE